MTPSAAQISVPSSASLAAAARRASTGNMSDRQSSAGLVVQSDLLGTLELGEEQVIEFGSGLLGFPECQRFALVPAAREGTWWLQSLDHATLAFLLVDPFVAFDGFTVDLGPTERFALGVQDPSDVMVLAIVTLPGAPGAQPTANLQAPIVFNVPRRRAQQMVIEGRYGMREAFAVERLPKRG